MAQGPTNNPIALGNLYPHMGMQVSNVQAGSEQTTGNTNDMSSPEAVHPIEQNFANMVHDNAVYAWIGLVAVTLGLMALATWWGGSKPAANIRFSITNIIVVLALSILGGSIAKVLATKYNLPFGVSKIILAS